MKNGGKSLSCIANAWLSYHEPEPTSELRGRERMVRRCFFGSLSAYRTFMDVCTWIANPGLGTGAIWLRVTEGGWTDTKIRRNESD